MANVRWPLVLARATGGLSAASSFRSSPDWQNAVFGSFVLGRADSLRATC